MKVISLLEPWASLIKEHKKLIETRSWATKYRGTLYIHASKKQLTKKDLIKDAPLLSLLENKEFCYGAIIAKCELVDCKYMDQEFIDEVKKNPQEYLCGEYAIGRYGWILKNVEVLKEPILVNGHLGIWNYESGEKYLAKKSNVS